MKSKELDGTFAGTCSNRLAESVQSLLVEHVRVSFHEDELKLQATSQRIDQIQASARAAESRLKQSAMSRLDKMQACLDRLAADYENLTAEIKKLEVDRNNVRSLLDRGNSDHWSDLERAAAKSSVDAALSDAAQEIAKRERQIETLLSRRERLVQDEQTWASSKSAGEDLMSSLTSGGDPTPFQAALTKERSSLDAAFQKTAAEAQLELAAKQKAHRSARDDLSRLEKELDEARVRAEKLDSARKLDWLVLRADPRSLFRRKADVIQRDLEVQQGRVRDAWSEVTGLGAKIDELGRQHEQRLALLPGAVRQKLIDETQQEITNASTRLAEIARMSDEVSVALVAEKSDLASHKVLYADEHQRHLDSHFAETLRQAERNLEEIGTRIVAATDHHVRTEGNRTRLLRMIEKRRAKLDADLLDLHRQESGQLAPHEREVRRVRLRLHGRAPRAGMVHDPATNSFREQDVHRSPTQNIRVTYRLAGDGPSTIATLPILLQRRKQTGYVGKDDERLAAVLASIRGEDEPVENERPALIDRFCDIVFGDNEDERPFFISIISEQNNSLLVLIRPAQVLPQLKRELPEAMSVCMLCRLDYGANKTPDNTTLFLLDAALVPDCEPRPFERTVSLVRHSSRDGLPLAISPLDELLSQANVVAPRLLDELRDRLSDWLGYLDWANDAILQRATWAALGPGEWTKENWEGVIYCEDKRAARNLANAGKRGDVRQSLDVYLLKEAWQRSGRADDTRTFHCTDFQVLTEEVRADTPGECPWPYLSPCRVRMKFSREDASVLADLPKNTLLGLRDMTEAVGSRSQIKRYRTALQQLQTVFFDWNPNLKKSILSNRLPAAPYLMASLFNVTQAAGPTARPGRLLNTDLAKLYRLNEDQGAAVEVMLAAPEIAYIQGPPGTGKTTMIAAACAHFVRSGQRVLIASQTNLAVENALERLIGDPEVRPLWLSRNEGEQKKSAAIADWYRMAADHAENAVCNPFRALTNEVVGMRNWQERARKLARSQNESAQELHVRETELDRANASLDEVRLHQEERSQAQARATWWAMAHNALATLADWDPSCFSPALATDAANLLTMFSAHDGRAPRLDVSPGALHRQAQERIQDIQSRLGTGSDSAKDKDAERIRSQILDAWPDVSLPVQDGIDGKKQPSQTVAQAEAAVLREQQSLEDAQSRANEICSKSNMLLSEIGGLLDLPELPTDLASAIELCEGHEDLQNARLKDVESIREWLPLLDQWAIDLRQQAENPPATDKMGERYVNSANVIGITCNSDFKILSDSGFPRFDVVIIDEVSKATPLELLRPMLLAPKAILVGDHRQLPPTFEFASFGPSDKLPTEDEDPDALERETDLLRRYERLTTSSLFRDGFSEINPGSRAALYTQYRMHPQIMSLVNRFYDGRLGSGLVDPDGLNNGAEWSWRIHGLSLNSRTGGQYLSPHAHALWIDSTEDEVGRAAYENSDNTGIENQLEARLVAQIVEDIAEACEREQRKKTIAVATFYNRQKRLIRKVIQERLGRRFKGMQIDVETVDRFQGKEADIVIVSMVRNRSPQQGRLGRNSNPAKFERINVAFSRARDLLVVVGARKTFEKFEVAIEPVDGGPSKRTCVYGQIIDDIRDAGGLWQAKDILGTSSIPHEGRPK
ncbi:MAG: hypothetical protein E6R09_10050 [Rhodocyclaceae bacterium]|nr:MAG: hypothetical protein E6R09_10050 [Rhodocyclaceae bacterium]